MKKFSLPSLVAHLKSLQKPEDFDLWNNPRRNASRETYRQCAAELSALLRSRGSSITYHGNPHYLYDISEIVEFSKTIPISSAFSSASDLCPDLLCLLKLASLGDFKIASTNEALDRRWHREIQETSVTHFDIPEFGGAPQKHWLLPLALGIPQRQINYPNLSKNPN